jgi:hypothetical protein
MASTSIKELALLRIKIEEEERLAKEQAALAAAAARAAERDRLEREARVLAAAERQQALLRAERLEAEQAAAKQAAAEQAALDAEITRLRARTPLEIMQDEMAEMKRLLAARPAAPPPQQLRMDGELDMRFKSSREEVASLREELAALRNMAVEVNDYQLLAALAEINELKKYMLALADAFRWSTMICLRGEAPRGVYGPTQWGCDTAQAMRASDSTLPPRPEDR